ncbi:MAG: hypothetical protein ACRCZI_02610 [Cetobacterium sp.]
MDKIINYKFNQIEIIESFLHELTRFEEIIIDDFKKINIYIQNNPFDSLETLKEYLKKSISNYSNIKINNDKITKNLKILIDDNSKVFIDEVYKMLININLSEEIKFTIDIIIQQSEKNIQYLSSQNIRFNSDKYVKILYEISKKSISNYNAKHIELVKIFEHYCKETLPKIIDNKPVSDFKHIIYMIIDIFKNLNIWHIYVTFIELFTDVIKSEEMISEIRNFNEYVQNHILYYSNIKNTKIKNMLSKNPWVKSYGLIPVSSISDLAVISKYIFDIKCNSMSSFIKICKSKKTDLIIITKLLANTIDYNIISLLDYNKSKTFEQKFKDGDGITPEFIHRMNTIRKLSHVKSEYNSTATKSDQKLKSNTFQIKYKYILENDKHAHVIVLEELEHNKYHILSNKYDNFQLSYICNKSELYTFIKFVNNLNDNISTRVGNYNDLFNSKVEQNMFLGSKPDTTLLQSRAENLVDLESTYLRYNIEKNIIQEFNKQIKTSTKSFSDFSNTIYNPTFNEIFIDTVISTYFDYIKSNKKLKLLNIQKNIPDLYMSFINILNNYERDFTRNMHDTFMKELSEIEKIFTDKNLEKELSFIFKKILSNVLDSVITPNTNIFNSINYKLQLLSI